MPKSSQVLEQMTAEILSCGRIGRGGILERNAKFQDRSCFRLSSHEHRIEAVTVARSAAERAGLGSRAKVAGTMVAELAGHASFGFTASRYIHHDDDTKTCLRDAVEDVLGEALSGTDGK